MRLQTRRAGKSGNGHGSSALHKRLVNDILLSLGSDRRLMVWSNETGAAYRGQQLIHYGLKGSADIFVLVKNGPFVGLEAKTGNATQSEQQERFERRVKELGHQYCVVRSVQEALDFIRGVISSSSLRL